MSLGFAFLPMLQDASCTRMSGLFKGGGDESIKTRGAPKFGFLDFLSISKFGFLDFWIF